ncbi:MAG: NYN domain-containing protein [Patescibacteria group bacterium]|nr:NYN domain-containing protein [Patescibacteria group bacterium]
MKQIKKQNNYAFIDSQNLNLGVRDLGWRLDFGRFLVYLKDKYQVSKAFLFIGYVAGNQTLYTQLQKDGYLVIFKPTLEFKKGKKINIKGNVDAELIMHSMIEWRNFDKAIIVSGDGDFHCLIEYLEQKKKLKKTSARY